MRILGGARSRGHEEDEALVLTAVLETSHCDALVLVGDFRGSAAWLRISAARTYRGNPGRPHTLFPRLTLRRTATPYRAIFLSR